MPSPQQVHRSQESKKSDTLQKQVNGHANQTPKGPLIRPRGLINNGNMCFMNSILQPLVHCTPFYGFFKTFAKEHAHNFGGKTPLTDAMYMMRLF
jgi:ubiquitin C-terminal hydrolase